MSPNTEKPIETRDMGTDPSPALEFDPFDDDGRTLLDWLVVIKADMQKALDELSKHTSGAPKSVKDDVIEAPVKALNDVEFVVESITNQNCRTSSRIGGTRHTRYQNRNKEPCYGITTME